MASSEYNLSVTEVSGPYKLAVTDGTELSLSLNAGLQGPSGPAGAAGPAGADGADALWNFRGELNGFIRVTGTLTDNDSNTVVFPDLFYNGNLAGKPSYVSGNSICYWQTNTWFLYFINGNVLAGSWYSVGNVASPELASNWVPISSATGTPVITLFSGSGNYAVGDVVSYRGSTWYCSTAFTFNPASPQYPDFAPEYWELVAEKGAAGAAGPAGPAGADGADGVAWNYTGEYSGGASYAIGDVATYDGELWYRTDSHGGNVGDTPSDVSPYWDLLAAKGEDGSADKLPLAGGAMDTDAVITLDTDSADSITLSGDALTFDNAARVRKGTTAADGNKGVALKCSVDYELKWEAGRLYTMEQDGFTIRRVDRCRNIAPTATDDLTKGFYIGSIWTLDDGTFYECTSSAEGDAVWVAHLPFVNGDGLAFNTTTNTLSCNSNVARRAGDQTFTGNNTFSGQMELTGQAATNPTSAMTRALGDARYGITYVGIKNENVSSVSNTPIKLTSVTLPVGTYQIDSMIAATAAASNGGYLFGLKAGNNIKISLFETYGTDGGPTTNNVAASDSTTLTQRSIAAGSTLTNKRQLAGLLEVITNNTEVSIEFSQDTTTPAVASTTRKRAYIIARKIA
jgi:hypothetical protein